MKRKDIQRIGYMVGVFAMVAIHLSCLKEDFRQTTDETPNIATYLKNSERFTLFYEALQIAGSVPYLDAWGTYTVFAPDNDAMTAYLSSVGRSQVADLNASEAKALVDRHIVADTVSTSNFRDGKIARNSLSGLFITTAVQQIDGQATIILNKEAEVVLPNQRTGNGLVHGIDKVFTSITRTVMEEIKEDPNLSIFGSALELAGLDGVLNTVEEDNYYSVLAVTDASYAQKEINNLQDLVDTYSDTGDPTNPVDSFYLHMAYHIVPDLKYVADLMKQSSHLTQVDKEIILIKVDQERVLVNEEEWLGQIERGAEINREVSDNTTKNGVLHYLKEDIFIKARFPFPIYWDPADQPEFRVAGVYGTGWMAVEQGFLKDVTWGGNNTTIEYTTVSPGTNMDGAVNNDQLIVNIRTAVIPWVELRTPVIVRGRYRVWVGWRTIDSNQGSNMIDTYFNGEKLSRQIQVGEYRTRTLEPRELEALGYKKHIAFNSNNYNAKMVGIIDVDVTDRHILRFETLGNRNTPFRIDHIHFIPVDMEQIYPMFDRDGSEVYP